MLVLCAHLTILEEKNVYVATSQIQAMSFFNVWLDRYSGMMIELLRVNCVVTPLLSLMVLKQIALSPIKNKANNNTKIHKR